MITDQAFTWCLPCKSVLQSSEGFERAYAQHSLCYKFREGPLVMHRLQTLILHGRQKWVMYIR